MTDRETMQQALEALIDAANVLSAPMFADAVAALSKALAQEHAMHNLARLGQEIEQEPLGSIALARSLCYQINGAADDTDDIDGGGYGSVDIAKILSAEVVRLQKALAQPEQQAEPPPEWLLIKNILGEYGLQAIDFVAEWKAAQRQPLTDKQILADETLRYYFGQNGGAGPVSKQGRKVVDAIEAAHGIGDKT